MASMTIRNLDDAVKQRLKPRSDGIWGPSSGARQIARSASSMVRSPPARFPVAPHWQHRMYRTSGGRLGDQLAAFLTDDDVATLSISPATSSLAAVEWFVGVWSAAEVPITT